MRGRKRSASVPLRSGCTSSGAESTWPGPGEILAESESQLRLEAHGGVVHRPSEAGDGKLLPVPLKGSLDSLLRRHRSTRTRLQTIREERRNRQVEVGRLFAQPPKPRFRQVAYDSPPRHLLFDLVGERSSWRLDRVVHLATLVRDKAAVRLKGAVQGQDALIDCILIGRGAMEADKAQRVRIAPLPSIGHAHADRTIRRVLVEILASCPMPAGELEWAFSGLPLIVSNDGEILCELAPASDHGMLAHYGFDDAAPTHLWRTVTPAVLPQSVARRRIDPARRRAEAKAGAERAAEENAAAAAVVQALRHAGVAARPEAVRVQREPFEAKDARAEAFAPDTRFPKERLWHVEVAFDTPQRGPLAIGDGRYLGLGLMARGPRIDGVLALAIVDGLEAGAQPVGLTRALRRAVLARAQAVLGEGRPLPPYLTGHEADGTPLRREGGHRHIAFAYDEAQGRLLILAPHALEHRLPWRSEPDGWRLLEEAVRGLTELRAGTAGKLRLARAGADVDGSPLFARALVWESATPYCAARNRRHADDAAALAADIAEECRRLRLPRVAVEVLPTRGMPGVGLVGRARLRFATAVAGPILLGRDRHFGGGLFAGCSSLLGRQSYRERSQEPVTCYRTVWNGWW
jgi:CRISPR-associated protein Csb2